MIDIVLTSKDRFNYLRITLATLKEALRDKHVKIYLWDFSSTVLPNISNELEMEIIRQDPTWANSGSHARYNHIITHAFIRSNKEYILQVDSDAVFHPLFYDKCLEMIHDLPGLGYGGVFNTSTHAGKKYGKYLKKQVIGAFGTLVNRKIWETMISNNYNLFTNDMEYSLSAYVNKNTSHGVCTTINSYIEHIGYSGTHKHGDNSIDKAVNFLDE